MSNLVLELEHLVLNPPIPVHGLKRYCQTRKHVEMLIKNVHVFSSTIPVNAAQSSELCDGRHHDL